MKIQNFVIWMQTASLFMQKTDDIYKVLAEDVETRLNTSNFHLERQLYKVKNNLLDNKLLD